MTKPVPEGYHSVTPYMTIADPAAALAFYEKAFGAVVTERHDDGEGRVRHAEVRIGDSQIMIGGELDWLGRSWKSPLSLGAATMSLYLYVEDVDGFMKRAIEAGATELTPAADQFYGDRCGGVLDPWGHTWWVATHVEDLSQEEMARRSAEHKRG